MNDFMFASGKQMQPPMITPSEPARTALAALLRRLDADGYDFVTATPGTHARVVARADRRVAEGLRQATVAERRAAAAQTRLVDLETRIDQAHAKLSEIGAQATEIARLVTTVEILPAPERVPYRWDQQHGSAGGSNEHQEGLNGGADLDPLTALASLRDTVDAASSE